MPDREQLNLVLGRTPRDLAEVRLPGLDRPFEELTINELVQLRPGGDVMDTYEVNAVTDNVSVTTSSVLQELGKIQAVRAMRDAVEEARLVEIRETLGPDIVRPEIVRKTGFGPGSG